MEYNVYCDESCHLENDNINVMTLGAVWCPKYIVSDINVRIREIKRKNGFNVDSEAKWTKVCTKHLQLYFDLVNLFFDVSELKFRGLVVPDKRLLNHMKFKQTYDDWYYKMYFEMLHYVFDSTNTFNAYIDIKDTNSYQKAQKLHNVCCNSIYDFSGKSIKKIQPIRSHEVEIMQLVDIFIGALAYTNRMFPNEHVKSIPKQQLIDLIKYRSRRNLSKTTLLRENKFNIFVWQAQ